MIKSVENAVSAFMQLAVVCTFGLSVVIGIAGVTRAKSPLACNVCAPVVAQTMVEVTGADATGA